MLAPVCGGWGGGVFAFGVSSGSRWRLTTSDTLGVESLRVRVRGRTVCQREALSSAGASGASLKIVSGGCPHDLARSGGLGALCALSLSRLFDVSLSLHFDSRRTAYYSYV